MNRPIIITAGIVLLLSTIGLWVYLLAYGAPEKPREIFTNLGFLGAGDNEVRVIDPLAEQNPGVQLSLGGAQLQQLTTRAVAGFAFVPEEQKLRYIERGTGHGYEINLESGTEIQISLTTIPQTASAIFSPNAEMVAITTYEGYTPNTVVGTFADDVEELALTQLPSGAENLAFEDEERIYFTYEDGTQTVGYLYNLGTLKRSEIFRVAFKDVKALWGWDVDGIFLVPKPSPLLEGTVYESTQNGLIPIASGLGTIAFVDEDHVVASSIVDGVYKTSVYAPGDNVFPQPLFMMPKKCAPDTLRTGEVLWCSAPLEPVSDDAFSAWDKGTVTLSDQIWYTDVPTEESVFVADLSLLAGRTVDASGLTVNDTSTMLLFSNKLDGTLWLYRIAR